MASFDMRGQRVTNQYNAGRDINFSNVQTSLDLVAELEKIREEFELAKGTTIVNEEIATDAEYQVTKAIQQAKKPEPDKKSILDHLNAAKTLVEGIAAAGGLVTAIVNAVEAVHKIF